MPLCCGASGPSESDECYRLVDNLMHVYDKKFKQNLINDYCN